MAKKLVGLCAAIALFVVFREIFAKRGDAAWVASIVLGAPRLAGL
jgi:hypothetical protein